MGESVTVVLQGDQTIQHAEESAARLAEMVAATVVGESCAVSIDRESDIDLSLVQTLISGWRTAAQREVGFELEEPLPDHLRRALLLVGALQPGEDRVDPDRLVRSRER